jgi:rhodanese-related sulfurtransferase
MKNIVTYLLIGVVSIVATATVILFTPLRYTSIVSPAPMHEISPTTFYEKLKVNPEAYLFIDVRPRELFVKEHAVGSQNIELWHLHTVHADLPKSGKTIVLICGGDETSSVGYRYLEHFGFTNLLRVPGGVPAWALAGLPIEGTDVASTTVLSMEQQHQYICPEAS